MDVESSWKLKVLAECLLTMTPSLFVDFSVALCCGLSGGCKRDFPCVKGHSDALRCFNYSFLSGAWVFDEENLYTTAERVLKRINGKKI